MASRSPQKVFENPTVAVTLDDLTDSPSRDTVLSEDQTEFLDAVRDGDHARVREYILQRSVDVNCVNLLGETALQIAVSNNRHEIAKFLLNEGADVGNALLYAVANESTVWVTLLLDFIEDLNAQSHATTAGTSRNQEASKASEDHCYTKYISPLVLAAQSNNQEIVKILLEKGYTIEEPSFHKRSCKCGECEGKRLGSSIHRLHSYRALASPVYLCLSYLLDRSPSGDQDIKSSKDPIICAFLLNRKLENLMEEEYELKNDYQALSSACEEFAVSLLTKCRSMEEIGCLMSVPGIETLEHVEVRGGKEAQKLSVLNFAIANKNEKFVAHPYSQMMLNSVLYDELGGWEDHNFLSKALFCLLLGVLLPVLALCYFVAPNSRISKLLKIPVFKFLSHTASSFWFLVLLVFSSIQDKFSDVLDFAPLDVLIMLWIAGMLFQEAKEAYRQGKERYLSQYWNLLTLFMLGLFIASGVLWLCGFFLTVSGKKTWVVSVSDVFGTSSQEIAYRLILLSNAFFSIGMVLAFLSFSNAFQVNSVLGPLQLSLVKMVRDVTKFLFLFLLLFLAFGWAERKVYSHYVQAREAFVGNATEHEFASIGGSLRFLFWDLFGMADLGDLKTDGKFAITQFTGELLLGLYSIASILVAINMLIAMMTNSYQQVADDADIQWKFSRTRMWMPYLDQGNAMPPPFNLIPPPHLVIQLCRRLCRGAGYYEHQSCQGRDRSATPIKDKVDLDKRHKVMTRLIQRYLLTVNKSKSQSHAAPESETFVAHPYSQMMLNSVLYDDLRGYKDLNFLKSTVCFLLLWLMLPFFALCYLVAPKCRISKLLNTPVLKFMSHTASFLWFLVLLILSSIQDKFLDDVFAFSPLDAFIALWVVGMLFQEAKEAYRQGKERYLSQYWNLVTLIMLALFVVSGVLWFIGHLMIVSGVKEASAKKLDYRSILLSNAFFAFGMVLAFFHISNSFQVNSMLGPLQLSLVKMVRDIVKFLFLFLLLFLAFAWAERKVYSSYVHARTKSVANTTHKFAKVEGGVRFLFWNLFGMSEVSDLAVTGSGFFITQVTGELLLALFNIVSVLVAMNMLIAVMSNSYQQVADDADIQWKFSRTRMWMPYLDHGNVMPPPFNLIPAPHWVFKLCRRLCSRHRSSVRESREGSFPSASESRRKKADMQRRHKVITRLIQRYLTTINKSKPQPYAPPGFEAESPGNNRQLRELISQLQDVLKRNKDHKDSPDFTPVQTKVVSN